MPLSFGPNFVEGKVYRGKKRNDEDDEKSTIKELQTILSIKHRKVCDCEAQIHGLLENCLNCGRLTCEAEGPGKCFNCDSLVLDQDRRVRFQKYVDISPANIVQATNASQPKPSSSSSNKVKVLDDQFDYFSFDKRKHLRGEDRRKLKEEFKELQAQRFKRKLVFTVDLDKRESGARSELVIEDYERALRDLELKDPLIDINNSRYNLYELVAKESKKSYSFPYVAPGESKKKAIDDSTKSTGPKASRIGGRASKSKHK